MGEVVLAVPRQVIDQILPEGFSNSIPLNRFAEEIRGHIVWGDRKELKAAAKDAQAIAYNIYVIEDETSIVADEISLYQRAKTVGEELLHGDFSIGYGGHVDKKTDYREDKYEYTDFVASLLASQEREDGEEITITDKDGTVIKPTYKHIGWINDNSNAIGQVHFAAVFIALLPAGSKIVSNEPNQIMHKPVPLLQLLRGEDRPYENWTRICIGALYHLFNASGRLSRTLKSIGA
jgi:predicted NUDIX family phosphoesterase